MREVHPRLVGADGRDSQWGVIKNSSGYAIHAYSRTRELVDLLVGSEGTLALFTAVEVALIPVAGARASLLAAFRDLGRAADAAVAARESGAAACELLDRTFLTIAAKAGSPLPVGADTEAALLVEVESEASAGAAAGVDRLRALFRSMGAAESIVAHDASHEAELWSLRHAASPAIARMDASLRSMQFIEDAAVPPSQLRAYVVGVRSVLEKHQTAGVIFGHAGDAHVHVNPLLDVSRADWRSRVEGILLDVTDLVARLGGTLTGEHGDGRLRTPLLDRVWGKPSLDLFSAIKGAFDPTGFLNPGVKVPLPGQRALDVVKYDPAAAELPTGARHALDVVDRERGYSRFRLELL
jgi:FAD/FMN-containing dehydrogenase